jgi:hypothetical protein
MGWMNGGFILGGTRILFSARLSKISGGLQPPIECILSVFPQE